MEHHYGQRRPRILCCCWPRVRASPSNDHPRGGPRTGTCLAGEDPEVQPRVPLPPEPPTVVLPAKSQDTQQTDGAQPGPLLQAWWGQGQQTQCAKQLIRSQRICRRDGLSSATLGGTDQLKLISRTYGLCTVAKGGDAEGRRGGMGKPQLMTDEPPTPRAKGRDLFRDSQLGFLPQG